MADELLALAEQSVADAMGAGATGAWARASRSRSRETILRDGKVEKVQSSTSRGLSLQVYADGRYSAHNTTDLVPDRLNRFVADAVAMTKALPVDPFREMPDPALFAGRSEADLALVDPSLAGVTPDQRESWAMRMDAQCHGDSRVISATCSVSDDNDEGAAASSNGFSGSWSGTSVWLSAEVTVRDTGDKRPEGSWYTGYRHQGALSEPGDIGKRALDEALMRLGSVKGPTVRATMVVDPRAAGSLISRLLSPNNAGSIFQGRSFWGGKLGQKVLSPKLTITDEPLRTGGFGSRLFDGEGIAAKTRPIITDGVLTNHYVDTYYGKKATLPVNGGSPSNRVVKLGEKGLAALLNDTGKGVYVTSWLGGNADPTTLDFSFGIRGHLIENGKAGAPVGEMNVTGNLATLFASLAAVGNDPWTPTSMLVPTLVFEGVQFSGV
jgi:PmbA protein